MKRLLKSSQFAPLALVFTASLGGLFVVQANVPEEATQRAAITPHYDYSLDRDAATDVSEVYSAF